MINDSEENNSDEMSSVVAPPEGPEFEDRPELEDGLDVEDRNEMRLEEGVIESSESSFLETLIDLNGAQTPILDQIEIQSSIEALLFISDKPLSLARLQELLGPDFDSSIFQESIERLRERYQATHHGVELMEIAGGFQLRTKVGRAHLAQKLVKIQTQRLSTGGMESLAIIAYKQPVMKEEVDRIRGVDSSYFIRGLMEKKLIQISGRSELPGRPLLYSTTQEFLEIFGLKDLSALPSLRELEQMIPTSETANPDGETPQTREMRRMVNAMNLDRTSELYYNPKEDEKILKEIREKVSSIATSTPYLDELKAAETLAQQEATAPPETALGAVVQDELTELSSS